MEPATLNACRFPAPRREHLPDALLYFAFRCWLLQGVCLVVLVFCLCCCRGSCSGCGCGLRCFSVSFFGKYMRSFDSLLFSTRRERGNTCTSDKGLIPSVRACRGRRRRRRSVRSSGCGGVVRLPWWSSSLEPAPIDSPIFLHESDEQHAAVSIFPHIFFVS